ncbi:hypothetical protein BVC93_22900 [Mycobacterium sp. MS1601]|nr:hypothetical protein BVC93_22900 [Mycobacterium sp. MS1601]
MDWLGFILVGLGVLSTLLGLLIGARDTFRKLNTGSSQAALPEKFLDVLLKLLDAPPAKFFCVFGLILIVLGLVLLGVDVVGSKEASAQAGSMATASQSAGSLLPRQS